MAKAMRRNHDEAFKTREASVIFNGEKMICKIAGEYVIHLSQIRQWRQKLLDELPQLFSDRCKKLEQDGEELQAKFYRQIGQMEVKINETFA